MDKTEVEKASAGQNDGSQLNRNRSFKSKQLVRSQAIRESHSPPRTISPYPTSPVNEPNASEEDKKENGANVPEPEVDRKEEKKQPIEIQITTGGWEEDDDSSQRRRSKRWVGSRHSDSARCLLNNPQLACVCGACECARCRSQRTKHNCPVKQDSGIACSVDCPDCDYDHLSANGVRKTASFEEQYYRGPDRRDNRQRSYWFTRSDSDIAEPSWAELVSFMKNTLNKNAKDRETLLRLERELLAFVEDENRCIVKFPTMTSYGRMLVHRCAALFRLAHRCDVQSRFTVLVSKTGTSCGRIPCTSFAQWCTVTFPKSPQRNEEEIAAKSILKRSVSGEGDAGAAEGAEGPEGGARSLQQRERDYERVRRRIFSTEKDVHDTEWPWLTSGPIKLLTPEPGRNKLIKVQSLESRGAQDTGTRGPVSKSHSLDGYGAEPPQPRLLSRQGDLASSSWRLSPSSSGYKTLSLRSTDSVTPSPTGCPSPDAPAGAAGAAGGAGAGAARAPVVCCVTDMSSVPPGALVIHPQTGKPLTHPDGSIYYFDPANPPVIQDETVYLQNGHQQNKNAEKRRGRLEKQHSFIDNDCDCPPEECQEKCCCDCPEQEICTKCPIEQLTLSPHSSKPNSTPTSPAKRPEPTTLKNTPEPANQRPTYDNPPNQRPPYDSPANHRAYDNATRLHTNNQNSPTRRQNYNPLQRYDVANQRYARYESQNQIIEVSARMEVTNQRVPVEVSANQRLEAANQRQGVDVAANQRYDLQRPPSYEQSVRSETCKGVEGIQYGQNYVQYRSEEITSPPQASHYQTPELDMQAMIAQKMTPVPMPEPNMRPMSIAANMMYPAVHQGYQYVNPCRLDQPLHPLYQQQLMQQMPQLMSEEHKQATTHPESTFRIDPSYPYATDFNAACGACGDPNAMQHQPRSVNVGYGQMEMAPTVVPQPYPMHNVMPQIPPYPYQDAMQWGVAPGAAVAAGGHKLLPDVYPVLCPVYPPYNMLYPQVIPQPYQICPPVYPVVDKQPELYQPRNNYQRQSKRSSLSNSSRTTPQTPDDKKVPYDDKNRESINNRDTAANNRENRNASDAANVANDANRANDSTNRENREIDNARVVVEQNSGAYASRPVERSTDIAESIAQIKQQIAQNKENSRGGRAGDEWRRRNCGGGILGSYPVNNFNGRVMGRPANEEAHINPALYNSIRNMQAKQNYQQQQERRVYEVVPHRFDSRYDNRRRFERDERTASLRAQDVRLQRERPDVTRGRPAHLALPLRPPYLFRQRDERTASLRTQDVRLQRERPDVTRGRPALPVPAGPASLRAQDVRLQRERPDVTRGRPHLALPLRPPYLFRQVTPNTWNRRSAGIIPPVMNHPRRPHPDRNPRR